MNLNGDAGDAALRRATATIARLRAALAATEGRGPIAVIGVGLRLPGGIDDLDSYWAAVSSGRDLVGDLPARRRWPFDSEWSELRARGSFLDDPLDFDPALFGLSPREACAMDPQHRLLLEVVWDALEHAAIPPRSLAGTRVGTFLGLTGRQDYADWPGTGIDTYWATGMGHSFAAGRVAYALDFTGPAMVFDTACSSSLAAVHHAVQALRRRECDAAVAGGVNLVLAPGSTRRIRSTGSLSPGGSCKTFDATADGYVRGEGCAIAVLKRLADAQRDGDRILAVVRGSAMNHDGRSAGFSAPNERAQRAVIEAALADAECDAADVGLLEAHGTGTPLGDPIEMAAIAATLGHRNGGRVLHVGSVKTNAGHLEAASGVVGLVKALLCLRHREVPPLVHFRTLNPRIDLTGTRIRVSNERQEWSLRESGPLAGVSSFGITGTNVHVLLGPAPAAARAAGIPSTTAGFEPSARSETALRRYAAALAERADTLSTNEFVAFAYTITHGRPRHPVRLRITAGDGATAAAALRSFAASETHSAQCTGDSAQIEAERENQGADIRAEHLILDLPHVPAQRIRCGPPLPSPLPAVVADRHDRSTQPSEPERAPTLHVLNWTPIEFGEPELPVAIVAGDDPATVDALVAAAAARAAHGMVLGGSAQHPPPGWSRHPLPDDDVEWRTIFHGTDAATPVFLLVLRAGALPDSPDRGANPAGGAALLCTRATSALRQLANCRPDARGVLITLGAHRIHESDPATAVHSGVLSGLAPVLGLELGPVFGGTIDLPVTPTTADYAAAVRAVVGHGNDDLLAVRAGVAHAARITPAEPTSRAELTVRSDATYLISGGAGGVGSAIAADLLRRGARSLLLLGRRPEGALPPESLDRIGALRAGGAAVRYAAVDCDDPDALRTVWQESDPPVRGIVHAAGTLSGKPIRDADTADFDTALRGKYSGAWWLHLLSRDTALDFFILISSASAWWGHEGHAAYAAANAGLDAIAAHRHALGMPALALGYGSWNVPGMADSAARHELARMGLPEVSPTQACSLLADAGPGGRAHALACAVDWVRLTEVLDTIRPRALFDRVRGGGSAASGCVPLVRLPVAERADAARERVRNLLAATLGHADPGLVDEQVGFVALGLDSIMAVDLARNLGASTGVTLKVSDVFDYPTVARLADHLTERAAGPAGAHPSRRPPPRRTLPPVPAGRGAAEDRSAGTSEPIAVIGMAGRFPGANSVDEFWELLEAGTDAVGPVPPERWDSGALRSRPGGGDRGTISNDQGGFLSDIDIFDADFFGITRREAENMDPQQRLLLQTTWHALEDAAIDPTGLHGSRTAVFVGISNSDYARLLARGGPTGLDAYFAGGTALNAAAGRISYHLGLTGPAMAIDTACSSSLVALHLAVRSLRAGESGQAIVGGVNIVCAPESSIAVSRAHMLSPTGRCRSFSARADGFVRAEACGVVLVKPLTAARRDGDRVLAVIRGTAVNQDGASAGLTVPNGAAQTSVITEALTDAGLTGDDIDYLEAHGTGTALGDPIEIGAAWNALRGTRTSSEPLWVGAAKSAVGHTESASGIVGVIKTVTMLRHGVIPPSLHTTEPNPHIGWAEMSLRIPQTAVPWPRTGRARRAGVSSFGFSGTNAHVVLEAASDPGPLPGDRDRQMAPAAGTVVALPVSAPDIAAFERVREHWQPYVDAAASSGQLESLAATAARGRAQHRYRRVLLADSTTQLRERWAAPDPAHISARTPRIGFVFPGAGCQYPDMGRGLYETEPVFRAALDECAELLTEHLDVDLRDVLYGEAADLLDGIHYTQPAMVAHGVALTRLWRSWGVTPNLVVGHSTGEITAAIVAGVLDLPSGLSLIAHRARLMHATAPGAMLALAAPLDQVRDWLVGTDCDVAAVNGPAAVVISGPPDAVRAVAATARAADIKYHELAISIAAHSRSMTTIAAEFARVCARFTFAEPEIAIVSNVSGTVAVPGSYHPDYWVRHLCEPVRFQDGVAAMVAAGVDTVIELGPDRTAINMIADAALTPSGGALASMTRGTPDRDVMVIGAAQLYELGVDIAWDQVYPALRYPACAAPSYPFAPVRYWTPHTEPPTAEASYSAPHQPHWGRELRSPAVTQRVFEFKRTADFPACLRDHRIEATVLVPASSHLATIASALQADTGGGAPVTLRDVVCTDPLIVGDEDAFTLQLLTATGPAPQRLSIVSTPTDGPRRDWRTHLTANLVPDAAPPDAATVDVEDFIADADHSIDGIRFYEFLRALGYSLGPAFQWVSRIWVRGDEALTRFQLPELPDRLEDYVLHPGLIDSCLQTIGAFRIGEPTSPNIGLAVPFSMRSVHHTGPARWDTALWAHTRATRTRPLTESGLRVETADITLWNTAARPLLVVEGLRVREIARSELRRSGPIPTAFESPWAATTVADATVFGGSETGLVSVLGVDTVATQRVRVALRFAGHIVIDSEPDAYTGPPTLYVDTRLVADDIDTAATTPDQVAASCADLAADLRRADPATPRIVLLDDRIELAPLTAAVEGLLACLTAEQPARRILSITLGNAFHTGAFATVVESWIGAHQDLSAVRLHGSDIMARQPVALPLPATPLQLVATSTVITGAFGGLGGALARMLAAHGARHLVLVGHHAPNAAAQQTLSELSESGVGVDIVVGDVTDPQVCEQAVRIAKTRAPLRYVFHLAAVVADRRFDELTPADFDRVFAAKAAGAAALSRACTGTDLAGFVLFSSAAATVGSPGQANYGAANGYLNGFASTLRLAGIPAVAVAWGPWLPDSGRGLAAGPRIAMRAGNRGVGTLSDAQAWSLLHTAITCERNPVSAMAIDHLRQLGDRTGRATPAPITRTAGTVPADHGRLLRALIGLRPAFRFERICGEIRGEMARALGENDSRAALFDDHRGFEDSGLDSIMMLDIGANLAHSLGIVLPSTIAMDHACVHDLATHLLEVCACEPVPIADQSGQDDALIRGLTDAELISAIERDLDSEQ